MTSPMSRYAGPQADERPGWPWLGAYEAHPRLGSARPVIAESGMVSTSHHQATTIGVDVLRAGGNAVDAAIAASAALMVTLPMQCSIGGDAIWIIRTPEGEISTLDASGRASSAADPARLLALGYTSIPHRGPHAVTVPGAVDGWAEACARYGTHTLAELMEPAARLAERGYFVSTHALASFHAALPLLERWGALAMFAGDGVVPSLYDRLRQPQLAAALREIGVTNGRSLYEGALAAGIVAAVRCAGGDMTMDDLRGHRSDWLPSITARFRGADVYTVGPATQGVTLLEALRIIETASARPLDFARPETVHLLIEALADALEDRDRVVTDRARMTTPASELYAHAHVAARAAGIDPARARRRARTTASTKGLGDTAHLAVVDANGCAVSLIQSLYFDFGSGIPVPEGGFMLQNRGAAFSLDDDSIRVLRPGARPPTTLAPTIVCRDGHLSHALGCMGGDGQVQTQVQLLVNMLDGGLDAQQAIARPRFYVDRAADDGPCVMVEEGIEPAIVEGLRERGHTVNVLGPSEEIMGHAQVVAVERGSVLVGGYDRRSDGQAAGW